MRPRLSFSSSNKDAMIQSIIDDDRETNVADAENGDITNDKSVNDAIRFELTISEKTLVNKVAQVNQSN